MATTSHYNIDARFQCSVKAKPLDNIIFLSRSIATLDALFDHTFGEIPFTMFAINYATSLYGSEIFRII